MPIQVREASGITHFAGDFPTISNYPGVNVDMLTAGDDSPFFITLAIAEIGRVSSNGLLYDRTLVDAIARQLQGSGGIQGHIPAGEESTNFPIDAVDWVGHVLENNILWAKAYVPPGETREYIRRLKARSGKLGTSISGYGEREFVDDDRSVWTSLNFELHSVDLAPAKMAALSMGGHFVITRETTTSIDHDEEGSMPISIQEVPDAVREEIIRQAQIETDAARVSELQDEVATLTGRIAELEGEIANQRETATSRISELENTLADRDSRLADYETAAFNARLDARIAEATDWEVRDDANRKRLDALRLRLRRDTLAEIGDERTGTAIETALQTAFDDNEVIIETMRDALAGPAASVGGTTNRTAADGDWETYKNNPDDLNKRWGTSISDT